MEKLSASLAENKKALTKMFHSSTDFYTKVIEIHGIQCCICIFEGLSSLERLWIMMLDVLSKAEENSTSQELFNLIMHQSAIPVEDTPVCTLQEVCVQLTAGTAVVLVNGESKGIVISTQSMQFRGVQEPGGEGNVRGSREGFIELLRVNISLVRRLIRSEALCVEVLATESKTNTEVAMLYNAALAPKALVEKLRDKILSAPLPMLFDSAYLAPFLRPSRFSFFSASGYTERPDTAAAKICEGKIVLLVNGSPFAMIVPYFFNENFQSMDDYSSKAYFASFIRVLKYIAFFVAILLPGVFVSLANFTPEFFPSQLLYKIAAGEQSTPLPLFLEAIFVNFLLEIVREAGLRLPKAIGHSVSLVAALIIGDASVKAGLLGTPVVVVVAALTSICAYVVPSLYEPVMVLRLLFILAGGLLGPLGIVLLFIFMLLDMCALQPYGAVYTAPIAPMQKGFFMDGLVRMKAQRLASNPFSISGKGREKRG